MTDAELDHVCGGMSPTRPPFPSSLMGPPNIGPDGDVQHTREETDFLNYQQMLQNAEEQRDGTRAPATEQAPGGAQRSQFDDGGEGEQFEPDDDGTFGDGENGFDGENSFDGFEYGTSDD